MIRFLRSINQIPKYYCERQRELKRYANAIITSSVNFNISVRQEKKKSLGNGALYRVILSGLFYNVVCTSDCVASIVGRMVNAELGRI
jgi:hypothetical protein